MSGRTAKLLRKIARARGVRKDAGLIRRADGSVRWSDGSARREYQDAKRVYRKIRKEGEAVVHR